jgi:hypothetical protein
MERPHRVERFAPLGRPSAGAASGGNRNLALAATQDAMAPHCGIDLRLRPAGSRDGGWSQCDASPPGERSIDEGFA